MVRFLRRPPHRMCTPVPRTLVIAALLLEAGCLGPTYEIGSDELQRLARTAPKDRGRRVRAVEDFGFEPEPPAADTAPPMAEVDLIGLGVSADLAARVHNPPIRYRRRRAATVRAGSPDRDLDARRLTQRAAVRRETAVQARGKVATASTPPPRWHSLSPAQ